LRNVQKQRDVRCGGAASAVLGRSFLTVTAVLLLDGLLMTGCSWGRTQAATEGAVLAASSTKPVLTLDVKEPSGLVRSHWPVSAGVPFPPAAVPEASHLSLADEQGRPAALQARVLSRWPDGSVRWALLDWQVDLTAQQQRRFRLGSGGPAPPGGGVKVTERSDRIEVDTGPLQFTVPKNRFAILDEVRVNGSPVGTGPIASFLSSEGQRVDALVPTDARVTENGPLRVRIELRGHYARAFDYVVRVDAFAGQPFVRVLHTFEQHSPEAYTFMRQLGIDVPVTPRGKCAYRAGLDKGTPLAGALPENGFTLFQEDNEGFTAGGIHHAGHAAGWVDLQGSTHGVAVAARFFWQEYPQSFDLRRNGVTYNLWAPDAAPAKVGMGAAKTHELVLYFHDKTAPSPALLGALTEPVLARIDPQWVVASQALRNSIAPSSATADFLRELDAAYRRYQAHADVERWDDSGQVSCADPAHERPRRGFYGMFNWGDWNYPGYHDSTKGCDAWGNLEYDMTQVLALAYAATGQREYYDGMVAAARHFMDVDRISYQRDHPAWVGMNHPKNPLHFAFELGGVDLGHTWTEGLLSYYYLSGDERSLAAARGIADYLVARLRAPTTGGNPRQWGWPQIALVATYEATGDDAYKRAAHEYALNGITAHPPEKIADWKMGILAEALTYTYAVTQDSAIRDWLSRYAAAVNSRTAATDPRFSPALAVAGRLVEKDEYTRNAAATVARLKFGNWGKPFTIAGRLGFSILSATASAPRPAR